MRPGIGKSVIYNVDTLKPMAFFDSNRGAKISLTKRYKNDPKLSVTSLQKFTEMEQGL